MPGMSQPHMRCLLSALVALVCSGAAALSTRASQSDTAVLVLANANVLDGTGGAPRRDVEVIVREGRLEAVAQRGSARDAKATVVDLRGGWVLPGMIDSHVHFRDLASGRAALRAGVTTARSLGADHFTDVGIRELHRAGASDVPDVLAAGYHVRRQMADALFLDLPQLRSMMAGVKGAADIHRVIDAMATRRLNFIKVMVTERAGQLDTDFRRRVLNDEELAAAVEAAERAGLPLAAHAHTDEGAAAAVRAGARTVEHGTLITASTLTLMKQRSTCLVPTLSFWVDMAEPGGEYDGETLAARAREMLPRARTVAAQAIAMGVKVAAGSDMRYDTVSQLTLADEVIEMTRSGISPADAIKSATLGSAQCLGIAAQTGGVVPGLQADLIVLRRDPLSDITSLKDVAMVINDGRIAADRLQ
jgi:imidazolonepropionase-like amidohydrolase